jgi:hypothetical protein
MDAQDSSRERALIPRLVIEQDTIADRRRRNRNLVLILEQHVEVQPRGGPTLVGWRIEPVPVLDCLKEVGEPSLLHPPLGDGPIPPGPPGDDKEAMTRAMELCNPIPRAGQEGTGTQEVGPIELVEEACDGIGRNLGMALEDLPSRLGHRNLQPKPPVEGREKVRQGMRHHIVNINANPHPHLDDRSPFTDDRSNAITDGR